MWFFIISNSKQSSHPKKPSNLTEGNNNSEYIQTIILITNIVKRGQGFAGAGGGCEERWGGGGWSL